MAYYLERWQDRSAFLFYVIAGLVFCFSLVGNVALSMSYLTPHSRVRDDTYTYIDDDFPELFPIADLPKVSLFIENTVHLQLNTSDSTSEWGSIFPQGGGYVHLGPGAGRPFALSMYHQLHCLRDIKSIIATPLPEKTLDQLERAHHCFNYIRQAVLCEPSLKIEPESMRIRDLGLPFGVDGLDLTHTCRDWRMVFKAVEDNSERWMNRQRIAR